MAFDAGCHSMFDGRCVGHVSLDREGPWAEHCLEVAELLPLNVDEHHGRARRDECTGCCRADSVRGARGMRTDFPASLTDSFWRGNIPA